MFIFFLSLGRHIEMVLRHRNLQAGAALARLLPEWAERLDDGEYETIPASDLVEGDTIRVKAGEAFPADGVVRSGATEVDEALLTGESRPVARAAGEEVIAGTINLAQPVDVEVTAAGQETTVSALGRLLLLAQSRREATGGLPAWLVPTFIVAVLAIAIGTWFGWQYVDPDKAFPAMLSVLVASCPCALSLALPVVHAAASRRLLDEGVLLTNGDSLATLTTITRAVFDKTGTLTRGRPEITATECNPQRDVAAEDCLAIAGALEAASAHPLAHAFMTRAQARPPVADNVEIHPARGLSGTVRGKSWRIGKKAFVMPGQGEGQDDVIWLGDEHGWVARFQVQDALRDGAQDAVRELQASGIGTAILSGDAEAAVRDVAERLGIDEWSARQTPEMKLTRLQQLREEGGRVLMVGDGVNDAPVLAAADVSMTVKGGAELAHSTADMILTGESLGLLLRARRIATRTRQLIRQNLTWAVLYNTSVMPLAVSGILKPWMAALGMSLSSLLVVANAARLVREGRQSPGGDPS
jgi:Cu2+-exporting ATPase